ncbi:P-loop containing nucleoside triphosphate hydrolase [Arabidopsis suecica]|uniref:P-loop containing nucleoside triphosphate hydrolase n=1 Tax=Arabidopsis suecica TaxID=45249 RepID=A0A8T2F622_ARASU|nr:P-loop containing nucleoside triphosphate hydrolase [Arabidopsis suecica]
MSKETKLSRRDSDNHDDEIENVPENLRASLLSLTSNDSLKNPKHECGSKIDRTPSKPRAKNPDPALPLRTPDKYRSAAAFSKNRFGWGDKCDSITNTTNAALLNTTPKTGRVVGRAYSETNSTQNTPTKSVSKPPGSCYRGKLDGTGAVRAGGYASLYKGLSSSSGQVSTVVNSVEVPHFSLKEDPSFWMDHNVQILIRVRPLNSMERSINGYNRCLKQESSQCVAWIGPPETRFQFDHVACETIDQETLFRVAGLPMVENCLSGYNSCIFAYGQTGSGKTYTMLGEVGDLEFKPSPNRGMMPRIFEFLFARIQAEEESRRDERLKYNCKCSFLEIYNEQITDLLEPSSTNLQLREDIKSGVYVENLTECEVQSVQDILGLITQGSLNRRVGATNMNRESSRSHSVFTCVIESRWEKDSTANMRFARLNLVDLAGSERQKTSGAEGDRLKEAASINKSLSTLGHVIMVLVDVANGKPRHIPYRDSRLTFLLQDSLGGNSKTMIIANASPSVSCAAETLNTLKFAQRAKLIQNNAVVNEDSNEDVLELRRQIRLLKEELSLLKRQNISRALSFGSATANFAESQVDSPSSVMHETGQQQAGNLLVYESGGCVRMSRKQLKSLEITLAGSLRREHVADASIKKLEAEIEHLNRLVRQREEDTRSTKMMLRFREDKIQRLESLLGNHISADSFLLEENNVLSEEIQLLQAKIDKNPELTRFALENIRLLDQLRRFQEFYEEGEREILLGEVSNLRNQLFQFLDENSDWQKHVDDGIEPQGASRMSKENCSLQEELKKTCYELEKCRSNLGSCLEENAKLSREINDLQAMVSDIRACTPDEHSSVNKQKALLGTQNFEPHETLACEQANYVEEIIKLQLDLDVQKIILDEERTLRGDTEAQAVRLKFDIEVLKDQLLLISKQQENVYSELGETKSAVAALESQNIILIQEAVELRRIKENYFELLKKQELDIPAMKSKQCDEFKDNPAEDSEIDTKFKKMQASLEKAKRLNMLYKSDIASKACGDEEMDEVCKQAEAATAEVIVCLQNELEVLQKEVNDFQSKENVTEKQVEILETQMEELQDKLRDTTMDNEQLQEQLRGKDMELLIISNEMELLTSELEEILLNGNEGLTDACYQADLISGSLPDKRIWISEQVGGLIRTLSERELMIEDLESCLEDANKKRCDIESMLKSLKGAAIVMNEAYQREFEEKETDVLLLKSQLCTKTETILRLQEKLKMAERLIYEASDCATASLIIVNRYSEVTESHTFELKQKDFQVAESTGTILSLKQQVQDLEATCKEFRSKLLEEEKNASAMEQKLEEIEETSISAMKEKLSELKGGVSDLRSCITMCQEHDKYTEAENSLSSPAHCSEGQEPGRNVVVSSCIEKTPNNNHTESMRLSSKVSSERGKVIILLKQEMESALASLKEVQVEMANLKGEKEELKASEKRSLSNLNDLAAQICNLNTVMSNMEEQYEHKMEVTDHKLKTLEHEIAKMKIEADQEYVENLCILKKFEEAQGTIREADITVNELVIANEKMRFDLEKQKKRGISLVGEKKALVEKLQELESINVKENEKLAYLEKLFESSLMGIGNLVEELATVVRKLQDESSVALTGMAKDLSELKSWVSETNSARLFLEDIWSEIIMKDCAISVLHLCHMGILLETVTGINTENGLLQRGLCVSNSSIAGLRDNNLRLRRELEMFANLKGKLLTDIKNGFERISRNEEATNLLTTKLSSFDQKISGLQYQEDLMLQRSNSMGSQLDILLKEIDLSNGDLAETLLEQERHLNQKNDFFDTEVQLYLMDLCSKDVELLVLAQTAKEYSSCLAVVDRELLDHHVIVEDLKEKLIVSQVEGELKDQCLVDNKLETVSVKEELTEAQSKIKVLSSDLDRSVQKIAEIDEVNKDFGERVIFLESSITGLQQELAMKASELYSLEHSRSVTAEELDIKERDVQVYADIVSSLKKENVSLKNKFIHFGEDQFKALDVTRLSIAKCSHLTEDSKKLEKLTRDGMAISDKMLQLICENVDKASVFADTVQSLQIDVQDLLSENLNLHDELLRKDDVLKGLSFDLSLLQESASNSRDKKDETKEIMVHVEALEKTLALKTFELEDAVSHAQMLEVRLQESKEITRNLEVDTEKARKCQEKLSAENKDIRAEAEDLLAEKCSLEEEMIQTKKVSESMEMELFNLRNALGQLNDTVAFTQRKLNDAIDERDNLQDEVLNLKEEFGKMKSEAKEMEARYIEAQQIAESRKTYADEREEEVKLLEGSVEKLEYTINVLENKVNVVKDEAERQRLQREELEMELHTIRQQMESARNADEEMKRILDEKHMDLAQAKKHIEALERNTADQKTEITQLSEHISELNLHAEAQASEYMHKFKELEAMAEQVKPEIHVSQAIDSSLSKGSGKPRGSGSPFRCIGLGITQQMRSEKDEELAAARLRIEELETVVSTRQKEIFLMNSKLAKVDSMTHDINRVLLGVKQNVTNCASFLDSQQVLKIAEMLQHNSSDSRERDLEVSHLKQQLNEYNEKRQGWIEEIEGKQTELVTAQIKLEEHRQYQQLLKKENELLKKENFSHKIKVMELEGEVKKLSSHQNPEWRTRDQARIKEENNVLKLQLDELNLKLRRADVSVSRAKEELAFYRASSGKNPHSNFDKTHQLSTKLKETEEDRMQLAQELLSLCTSILKAAGVTGEDFTDINPEVAEEALEQLKTKLGLLESEVHHFRLKGKAKSRRSRNPERKMPSMPSPRRSWSQSPRSMSQVPFFSSLDR